MRPPARLPAAWQDSKPVPEALRLWLSGSAQNYISSADSAERRRRHRIRMQKSDVYAYDAFQLEDDGWGIKKSL